MAVPPSWIELVLALRWPVAMVLSCAVLARAVVVLARSGIRVEIFTRIPIQIKTGAQAIEAKVTKVKLL